MSRAGIRNFQLACVLQPGRIVGIQNDKRRASDPKSSLYAAFVQIVRFSSHQVCRA